MKQSIAVFTASDYLDPAARIRGFFIVDYLSKNGWSATCYPFEIHADFEFLGALKLVKDFMRKINIVRHPAIDIIYVQRGISPSPKLTLLFLFISKYIFKRKIVYDIDDGLFLYSPFEIDTIIRISDLVVVGGHTLREYISKINSRTFLMPTSVNLLRYPEERNRKTTDKIVLGFVGSPTTIKYLKILEEPLIDLASKYDFSLRIIAARKEDDYKRFKTLLQKLKDHHVKLELVCWDLTNEPYELSKIDVGLAPLFDGEWEHYKCGFKVINYMAAAIPPVASNVGEHRYLIHDGVNGFLCENDQQWVKKLGKLIEDGTLREKMGKNARRTVDEKYSFEKNAKTLAKILSELL